MQMGTLAPIDKQGFCRRQVGIFLVLELFEINNMIETFDK